MEYFCSWQQPRQDVRDERSRNVEILLVGPSVTSAAPQMGEEGLLCLQCNQGQGYQWCDPRFSNLTLYHGKKKKSKCGNPACSAMEGRLRIVVDQMINPESNK